MVNLHCTSHRRLHQNDGPMPITAFMVARSVHGA